MILPRRPVPLAAYVLIAAGVSGAICWQWLLLSRGPHMLAWAGYLAAALFTALWANQAAAWTALGVSGVAALLVGWPPLPDTQRPWLLVDDLVYLFFAAALVLCIGRSRAAQAALRQRELAYEDSREHLRAIFQSSSEGLAFCRLMRDAQGKAFDYQVLDVNPSHAVLTGASREAMLAKPVTQIQPPVDPRWISTAEAAVSTGKPVGFDVRSRNTGYWLNIRVSPVAGDFFSQAFIDVSDRYRLQEQRDHMLAEMNHRVKNNFQMIAAVLDLQSRRTEDAVTRAQLSAAAHRVIVLAELHSSLLHESDTSQIDFRSYLLVLSDKLRATIEPGRDIRLQIEVEPATLPTEQALRLGFIINEVVTNAIKHAFPSGGECIIDLSFSRDGDDYLLSVADNGCGFPNNEPPSGGLGMRLITTLATQLDTRIEVHSDPGVRYDIRVNATQKRADAVASSVRDSMGDATATNG